MKKYYSLLFFVLFSYSFAQTVSSDTLNYLSNGIVEDQNGKIITDSHQK